MSTTEDAQRRYNNLMRHAVQMYRGDALHACYELGRAADWAYVLSCLPERDTERWERAHDWSQSCRRAVTRRIEEQYDRVAGVPP